MASLIKEEECIQNRYKLHTFDFLLHLQHFVCVIWVGRVTSTVNTANK